MGSTLRAPLVGPDPNQQPCFPISCAANIPPSVLVLQQVGQEADVLHSEPQDLILAQLLVRGVSGDEFAKLRKRPVYVLLPPTFTTVGEDTTYNLRLAS